MRISEMQAEAFDQAKRAGFLEGFPRALSREDVRAYGALGPELADIVLRVGVIAACLCIDLDEEVEKKAAALYVDPDEAVEYNQTRPHRHGREEGVMDEQTAQSRFKLLVRRIRKALDELEAAVENGELKKKSLNEVSAFAENLCSVNHLKWELGITRIEWEAARNASRMVGRLALMGWGWADGRAQS
jgi:NTP pyrophosphatase (non-canonical NTP hydrolase)